jgi:hypothetical protein
MGTLPKEIVRMLRSCKEVFSERVWHWVVVLVVGAILVPGQRTVASVLRVMGLSTERQYQNYHRVLSRARWSSRDLSRCVLGMLVRVFVPVDAPILVGLDETIERRRGAKIGAKGIYRDLVLSSKGHFVKAADCAGSRCSSWPRFLGPGGSGVIVLDGVGALRTLDPGAGPMPQDSARLGRQMLRQLRRSLPDRSLVVVADSTYAVVELVANAAGLPQPVTVITRLRLDTALYDSASSRSRGPWAGHASKASVNRR